MASFLEREAGHFNISLVQILVGAVLWKCEVPRAEDLILIGAGYMGRSMVGPAKGQAMNEATIQHITDILREMQGTLSRVEEQTTKTNGRVSRLEDRVVAVHIRLASRTDSCPMVTAVSADVSALRDIITANTATAAANKNWSSALSPILYAILAPRRW